MGKQKHEAGKIINGYIISGEPKREEGWSKSRYPFECQECGKSIGYQEPANVSRRIKPCACKVGQPDPDNTPKFVKESEDGCTTICHDGITEYWHSLVSEDGLSQRQAADKIHEIILHNTNDGETLAEPYTPEKIRNIGRTNTGRKKASPQSLTASITSPNQVVEKVRKRRLEISELNRKFQQMVRNNQLTSDQPYKKMENEMRGLKAITEDFLPCKLDGGNNDV